MSGRLYHLALRPEHIQGLRDFAQWQEQRGHYDAARVTLGMVRRVRLRPLIHKGRKP